MYLCFVFGGSSVDGIGSGHYEARFCGMWIAAQKQENLVSCQKMPVEYLGNSICHPGIHDHIIYPP
jgi:hypothetical protein